MYNRFGLLPTIKKKNNYDKQLASDITSGTYSTFRLLYTATYPCVVLGLIINGSTISAESYNLSFLWIITVVKEGQSLPTLNIGSIPFAKPEEYVMAFGSGIATTTMPRHCECKTKTSRKLMSGDSLYFIWIGNGIMGETNYAFQFFLRT